MILLSVGETLAVLAAGPDGPMAEVLAGRAGLGREVAWASGARTSPPLFPTLKGGELALAAAPALAHLDPPTPLVHLLTGLIERGAAGLLLRGPLAPADEAAARTRADEAAFPLILLPPTTGLGDLERAIISLIRERRDDLYARTTALHDMQVARAAGAAHEQPLPALIEALARLTGLPTALAHPSGGPDLSATAVPPGHPSDTRLLLRRAWASVAPAVVAGGPAAIGNERGPTAASEPAVHAWPLPALTTAEAAPAWTLLTCPIVGPGGVVAVLVQLCPEPVRGLDSITLARAAAVAALEWERDRLARRDRAGSPPPGGTAFLHTLLTGPEGSEDDLRAQAQSYQIPLARGYAVALVAPAPGTSPMGRALDALAAEGLARSEEPAALWHIMEGQLVILWPLGMGMGGEREGAVPPPAALRAVAEQARGEVARRTGGPATAGLGQGYLGLRGIARSAGEATQAITLGRRLFGGDGTWSYEELGVYRLLLPLRAAHPGELRTFVADTLGPLATDRRAMAGALLATLTAYLAHGGNASQTAAALHLHRNTLTYRLHRIRQITGLDLDDPEARLRLHLALKVRRLL